VSSGKTTLGLYLAGRVQAQGGMCAWIDADHSLDVDYAMLCGVQPESFLVSETQNLEQGFYILERLASSGAVDWLVLDSLTALPLEAELAGDFREDYLHQRDDFLRQALHNLVQTLQSSQATVLFISQTRHRTGHIYQSDQASTASLALKLRSGARFELVGTEVISDPGRIVGQAMQIRIVKHLNAQIFPTINVDIMYNRGINKNSEFRVAG
jgi:recombination protein RecA